MSASPNHLFLIHVKTDKLLNRALNFEFLSIEEGVFLFENAPITELMYAANELRKIQKPDSIAANGAGGKVTWQIDRNVNTTNVCVANCKFCNFYRIPGHAESYITDIETYKKKIEETFRFGGDQLLLQGGHHPDLGLKFYTDLFRQLKSLYPKLKLHSLGPPEVAHITKLEKSTHTEVLKALVEAGLDSRYFSAMYPLSPLQCFVNHSRYGKKPLSLYPLRTQVYSRLYELINEFKRFFCWTVCARCEC